LQEALAVKVNLKNYKARIRAKSELGQALGRICPRGNRREGVQVGTVFGGDRME